MFTITDMVANIIALISKLPLQRLPESDSERKSDYLAVSWMTFHVHHFQLHICCLKKVLCALFLRTSSILAGHICVEYGHTTVCKIVLLQIIAVPKEFTSKHVKCFLSNSMTAGNHDNACFIEVL